MSASSNPHVQDNSVIERRLRPIYDWLDSGNNKKALQECEKVLRKTPKLQCAKALKALTLHRMGKEESSSLLDALIEENPTDEATLQAMTLCCKEMQDLERICRIYEAATKLDPSNEEIQTQLFMSFVRISDFKNQHKVAMALYKHKPKNPYYCWAVMSVILQATRGEGASDPNKRKILLNLAERMMDKLISNNQLEAEQEVQLYIMILELQGKNEEILKVLDGPLGARLTCTNVAQNKITYLKKVDRWKEVNLVCKGILLEAIDRWDIWKTYIESIFQVGDQGENNHSLEEFNSVDDSPEKAHEFICRIIEGGADNACQLRGAFLARFEMASKMSEPHLVLGDLTELFVEYFRKFGHKPCCVSDLRGYLDLLDEGGKAELAVRLVKDVGISSTSVPQSEQQMQKHIGALQLSRLCGSHRKLPEEHLRALVTALSLHYQHGYQAYGTNLLPTDMGPSDPYALLAVHILYDLAKGEEGDESLIVGLILLDNLLKNSPSNFHGKLLSVKLYHILGGTLEAHEVYNSLDIKHINLDSLGYIHCARLPCTGQFSLCSNLFDVTLKFFSSNYKDSSDHLTFSYKFGSFLKLEEFMDFRERLNNSLHYNTIDIDRVMLSLVECTSLDYLFNISFRDINFDKLRDNHDLGVNVTWDPERISLAPEEFPEVKEIFKQDVHYLKIRVKILQSVFSGLSVIRSTDGDRQKHLERLKSVLTEWEQLEHQVKEADYKPTSQDLICMPFPSRLFAFLETPSYLLLSSLFSLLDKLAADDLDLEGPQEGVKQALTEISELAKRKTKSISLKQRRKDLEVVVNIVELVSVSTMVCLMCNELMKPMQGKKGKKKTADSSKRKEVFKGVVGMVLSSVNEICDLIQSWAVLEKVDDLSKMLESLNLNGDAGKMYQSVANCYEVAKSEIQGILKGKIKLLNSIVGQ